MWLQQIIRTETGCATYLVGADNGECLVFDPLWDILPFLAAAEKKDARIRYVIDSHTHADHVSGARRLAAACGAELVLPQGAEAEYTVRRIRDLDRIRMGEVVLEVAHVPGHRPEQINLVVTDESRGDAPWCILTADFLLVGDIARPDLAQGGVDGAAEIFDQALPRIAGLLDFVEVYPGHVAGSTCGRVTSGKHVTTLGYERRFNPALTITGREAFIHYLNQGQPSRPANVEEIVRINQGRRPYAFDLPVILPMSPDALAERIDSKGIFVIDTRDAGAFGDGHIPGSHNVQLSESEFEQRVGWILPDDHRILLVGAGEEDARQALLKLAFLGLESRVDGFLAGGFQAWEAAGKPAARLAQVLPAELSGWLSQLDGEKPTVLDVREPDEWAAGHVDGAVRISYKELDREPEALGLDRDRPVVVYCAGGNRSSTAGSILNRRGFKRVHNLTGGLDAWKAAELPVR